MTRLLYFTDVHYTESTPARRRPGYGEQILAKMDWINRLGVKLNVDAYLCGGDWFHNKRISMVELNNITQVIRRMTDGIDHSAPVISIIGNHDVPGHQSGAKYKRAIGVLYRAGLLIEPPFRVGATMVQGRSYVPDYEADAYNFEAPHLLNIGPGTVYLTHGNLVRKKLPFDFPQVVASEVAVPAGVLLLNGHIHHPFELPEAGIWNAGSVCRCSIENQKSNLVPRVLVLQWDGIDWKVRPVDIPVEDDVWTADDTLPDRAAPEEIQDFVQRLESEEVGEALQGREGLDKLLAGKSKPICDKVHALLEAGAE